MHVSREVAAIIAAVVTDVAVLGWLFVRVGKEQIAIEDTATKEMLSRTIDFYKRERASRDGLTRSESRIGHTGPTTNDTRSMWD